MANKSFGYLIKQGFKNIVNNKLMSFSSVSVLLACLILVGGSLLVYINIQKGIEYVGSLGEIVLFVEDGATDYECSRIQKTLEALPQLHDVEFVTGEQGLQELKNELDDGDELFSMLEGESILPDSFRVKVTDAGDYEAMVTQLSQISGISSVSANGKIAATLTSIGNAVALFAVAVVAVLMVVSVFILVNTLKATMYNRRREIYIMKMIGATDSFVQLPFFVEGVVLGVISALIAYLVIRLGYVGMADYLEAIGVNAITWPELRLWVLLSFLGVGFAVGLFSSSVSIKKYLKV